MSDVPLACRPHDHAQCVQAALAEAELICTQRNLRLTPLRKRVLELVWQSHRPLGAYDILARLSEEDDRKAAPPTVYRALDFLLEHGLVHRIASLNAFIGCSHPEHPHQGQFLICSQCHSAVELESPLMTAAIAEMARSIDFEVQGEIVEVVGICQACRSAG